MGGLARRVFTLCSAVSLLLCVAACALWARTATLGHFEYGSATATGSVWRVGGEVYVRYLST